MQAFSLAVEGAWATTAILLLIAVIGSVICAIGAICDDIRRLRDEDRQGR